MNNQRESTLFAVEPSEDGTGLTAAINIAREDGAQIRVMETNRLLVDAGHRFWANDAAVRDAALRLLGSFGAAVSELESLGWSGERIRQHLEPSRQVFATSSFMRRCQQWSRGYPGDFETIEYLTAGINDSGRGTLGWQLEQILLESPVVQQHHNKLARQSLEIARTVTANSSARVLSIACGGCLDWVPVLPHLRNFDGQIVLNDADPVALELAERRLRSATPRYRLAPGNILRVAKRLIDGTRFDLVVAGGLFDYLSDKSVVFLLRAVSRDLLSSGGVFLFTNIAKGNPYRALMEYGANWALIERSEGQVRELCRQSGMAPGSVWVDRDSTGLALITRVVQGAIVQKSGRSGRSAQAG